MPERETHEVEVSSNALSKRGEAKVSFPVGVLIKKGLERSSWLVETALLEKVRAIT